MVNAPVQHGLSQYAGSTDGRLPITSLRSLGGCEQHDHAACQCSFFFFFFFFFFFLFHSLYSVPTRVHAECVYLRIYRPMNCAAVSLLRTPRLTLLLSGAASGISASNNSFESANLRPKM